MMNYLDWFSKLSCLVYIFLPTDLKSSNGTKLFLVLLMVFMFYRMYNLLSIITLLTSQIQIVNQIIIKVIPFSMLILFFYSSTSLMMIFVDTKNTPSMDYFRDVYYWVIFGGFDDGAFEQKFSIIPVVFGTIMVGVLLFNILIAYLSNEFSRLEEQQIISGLKMKAWMNLRFELLIFFFRNGFKRVNNIVDSETLKYERMRKAYNNEEINFLENSKSEGVFLLLTVLLNSYILIRRKESRGWF